MAEVLVEATYVRHHKKKIALIFSAMRHFAEELKQLGYNVEYIHLDDPGNTGSLKGEVERAMMRQPFDRLLITEPGEWRLREELNTWPDQLGMTVEILEDDRFIASITEFESWAYGRKQLRMEYFYRLMRRKTGLLMTLDGEPEGHRWNFDSENRKPAKSKLDFPTHLEFEPDSITEDVLRLVEVRFNDHFGELRPFWFPVTRSQAVQLRDAFIERALPQFGKFQDAMLADEKFLFHSLLSSSLNIGLLDPLDLCRRAEKAFYDGKAPLNSVEGFIRQIIGWREYVRGFYWLKGPDYGQSNFLQAEKSLPDFYWTGKTEMACVSSVVTQTKVESYAHHIQRLMITGNFALLSGVSPQEVHEWYLAVYADAFEWVELPNTLGMSQFADGGILASKPYAASGSYINKMSDYCRHCAYDVNKKHGENACPFNFLYWDFIARHRDKLQNNPRMAMVYRTWNQMKEETRHAHRSSAAAFKKNLG